MLPENVYKIYFSNISQKCMYNTMFNRLHIYVYVLTTNNNNVQLAINRFKFNIWPHDCVDKCLDHKLQNPNQFARYYLLCVATATLPATFHTTNVCLVSIHTHIHTKSNKIIAKQQCYNTLDCISGKVEVDQVCVCVLLKQCNVSFCCCNHVKEVLPQKCGVVKRKYSHAYFPETYTHGTVL